MGVLYVLCFLCQNGGRANNYKNFSSWGEESIFRVFAAYLKRLTVMCAVPRRERAASSVGLILTGILKAGDRLFIPGGCYGLMAFPLVKGAVGDLSVQAQSYNFHFPWENLKSNN